MISRIFITMPRILNDLSRGIVRESTLLRSTNTSGVEGPPSCPHAEHNPRPILMGVQHKCSITVPLPARIVGTAMSLLFAITDCPDAVGRDSG